MNCYLNPTHTPAADTTEASYCLTEDKENCYDGETDAATYDIIQIDKATVIGSPLSLDVLWFSNDTIIWNNQTSGW